MKNNHDVTPISYVMLKWSTSLPTEPLRGRERVYTKYPLCHTLRQVDASLTNMLPFAAALRKNVESSLAFLLCAPLYAEPLLSRTCPFLFSNDDDWISKTIEHDFLVEKSPPKTRLRRYKPTFTYHCRQMLLYSWCTARSSFWSTNQLRKNTPK